MEASQRNNKLSGALWMDLDHPDFTLALRWCNFLQVDLFHLIRQFPIWARLGLGNILALCEVSFYFYFFTHSTHHMNMYHQVFKFLNLVCVYIHWQNNKSQFWNQTPPPIPKKKKRFTCIYETCVDLKIKIVLKQLQKRDATLSSFSFIYCQLLSISVPLKRNYRITQNQILTFVTKIYMCECVCASFISCR